MNEAEESFNSPEQKILQDSRLKKMINQLFRFVFAGVIFFGKLSLTIGSKLWLLKTKFLLAALTALLSIGTYALGSENSKKTTLLKPSVELIRFQKTIELLPDLQKSFISSNQQQLHKLAQNLKMLKHETLQRRESILQLRKDFLKAIQTLETNYEVILAEKKETMK